MSRTIDYYNDNAEGFFISTVNADMSFQYDLFEKHLRHGARILDCGCGSGRDSKHFLERGYEVTAIDASEELCKKASDYIGLEVKKMLFQDIEFEDEFDGVWACASLLHVKKGELKIVFERICRALRNGGILYASFKYGNFEGERNGRMFTDLNEDSLGQLVSDIPEFSILEKSLTEDVRPGRDEKWLNVILVKNSNYSMNYI